MREDLHISSLKNPRVRAVIALGVAKERRHTGLFAVEGAREIGRAVAADYKLLELFVCTEALSAAAQGVLAQLPQHGHYGSVQRYQITPAVFAKLAVREGSDGLIAVFAQRVLRLADLKLPDVPLLLAVQNLEKPGNLGAVLRSADGAGVDAVIYLDRPLDLYHPQVLRNSLGTVFHVPVVAASSAEMREFCGQKNLQTFAAALTSTAVTYTQVDYKMPCVLLLGEEAQGLSADWLDQSTACIKVPMLGMADSLNVAAAGAVMLYEARRQRSEI